RFLHHWPRAADSRGPAYEDFLQQDADLGLQWIKAQPEFLQLTALQDTVDASKLRTLELQREYAQYDRLLRAIRLANLKEHFDRSAKRSEREHYAAITHCEAWAPPST